MNHDRDSGEDSELETAVAAASFAIVALEEEKLQAALTKITSRNESVPVKKWAENWFWRQTSDRMSDDSTSSEDNEYETAIAAAAFTVATLKEAEPEASYTKINITKDSRAGLLEFGNCSRQFTEKQVKQEKLPAGEASKRKPEPVSWNSAENSTVTNQNMREEVMGPVKLETEADAWENTAMAKIRKRYEKQYSTILSWENEKKARARLRLDEKEGRLYLRNDWALQAYETKVEKINKKARGARARAEERKQNDESKIKEKANKIRSTGRVPVTCFCF